LTDNEKLRETWASFLLGSCRQKAAAGAAGLFVELVCYGFWRNSAKSGKMKGSVYLTLKKSKRSSL
jgi:hypothetical protein